MKKLKRFTFVYFILSISLISTFCYLDYHSLNRGSLFHNLSSTQRNLVRTEIVATIAVAPISYIFSTTNLAKPRNPKTSKLTTSMFIGLIPSYLFYIKILGMWSQLMQVFIRKRRKFPQS